MDASKNITEFLVLGFIIFPFIWAVPEALVTAELGAAFQDPSAGLAWVEHAFGERMGGLCGYFGWLSGALGKFVLWNIKRSPTASVKRQHLHDTTHVLKYHAHVQTMQSILLCLSNTFLA